MYAMKWVSKIYPIFHMPSKNILVTHRQNCWSKAIGNRTVTVLNDEYVNIITLKKVMKDGIN